MTSANDSVGDVGLVIDEVDIDVERGKIGEFVRATRTTDPIHLDPGAARAAGLTAVPATATHLVVAGHHRDQLAFVRRLGLELARVVVGSVSWRYERPVVAGDRLHGKRTVVSDEVRTTRRGTRQRLITLQTEYRDPTGTLVVSVVETVIERGSS